MSARDEPATRPVYTDPPPRPSHCGPGHCRGLTCCSYECAQGRCPAAIADGIIPAPGSEETQP